MRRPLLLSFLIFCVAPTLAQTLTGTIKSGGRTREYRLYKPASYTGNKAVPLVINLHGYGSNNFEQEFYGSFKAVADTADFLVALPNGTIDNTGKRFWNTFGGASTVDDVAFIDNLIDSLKAIYNIDPQRIYSTGMSNGGFMSYALACKLNNRIAAIASVTGSMIVPDLNACKPKRPVPVMEIHGTADPVVPYEGGTLLDFAPVPKVIEAWVGFNQCNPMPLITPVPNTNPLDGCTAERIVYAGGKNGAVVEHYKVIGGGHTWPGSIFITGVTNKDFDASFEIWRFFRRYRLDALSDIATPEQRDISWNISPNPSTGALNVRFELPEPAPAQLEVFDLTGRLRSTGSAENLPAGAHQKTLNLGHLNAGVYWVRIRSGAAQAVKRVVLAP
jgi:polyhydroxybutyrate depolymerase